MRPRENVVNSAPPEKDAPDFSTLMRTLASYEVDELDAYDLTQLFPPVLLREKGQEDREPLGLHWG